MNENPEGLSGPSNLTPSDGSMPPSDFFGNNTSGQISQPLATSVESNYSTDPMNRPMEKAQIPNEPSEKKSKTGLIVGIVLAILVLVGGGIVFAAVLNNSNKKDAVAIAFNRLVDGTAPENMLVSGTVDFDIKNKSIPFEDVNIKIKSEIIPKSLINSTSAVLTAKLLNGNENIDLYFDEIYVSSNELYFKMSGVEKAFNDLITIKQILYGTRSNNPDGDTEVDVSDSTLITTDSTASETTDSEIENLELSDSTRLDIRAVDDTVINSLIATLGIIRSIDGKWIRLQLDEITNSAEVLENSNEINCISRFVNSIGSNTNSLKGAYNKNPFIISTDKNLPVVSKDNPIYKVVVDEDGFRGFAEEAEGIVFDNTLYGCIGSREAKLDIDSVLKSLSEIPDLYVEVNNGNNFSRLYFETTIGEDDGCYCPDDATCAPCLVPTNTSVVADFDISYPANVNVAEPGNYVNFEDIVQSIIANMFVIEEE